MGYPGKNAKTFETPNHPYQGGRIQSEHSLVEEYGLKNKRELWNAESELRRYRREARRLLGAEDVEEQTDQLMGKLRRYGVLGDEAEIDDVLSLSVNDLLERRLQTVVHRDGMANTPAQARQFITHGHIAVDGRRVTVPGYTVETDEESRVEFADTSPLAEELHPERATAEQGE